MKIFLLIIFLFLATGCYNKEDYCAKNPDVSFCFENQESKLKTEEAIVIDTAYVPSQTFRVSSNGMGMDLQGNVSFTGSSGTASSKEIWAVVFRCKNHHQTFSINSKPFYDLVSKGDTVILEYVEIVRINPWADYDVRKSSMQVIDYNTKKIILKKETK